MAKKLVSGDDFPGMQNTMRNRRRQSFTANGPGFPCLQFYLQSLGAHAALHFDVRECRLQWREFLRLRLHNSEEADRIFRTVDSERSIMSYVHFGLT